MTKQQKLRRYQISVVLDKFVDVVADNEKEAKRIAQARIDELVKDLLETQVSAWDMAVGDMFYEPLGSAEETETDNEEEAWHGALRSEDYPKSAKSHALLTWEKMFREGYIEDGESECIADALANARKELEYEAI